MRQLLCGVLTLTLWGCSDPAPEDASAPIAATRTDSNGSVEPTAPPAWLPEALQLPDDADILADRSIGRSTRLLQVRTGAARDALLDDYHAALDAAGYETRALDERVLFEGQGIEQGSVGFADTLDQGPLLQIDVTLENP